jgi:hypothetical protein
MADEAREIAARTLLVAMVALAGGSAARTRWRS